MSHSPLPQDNRTAVLPRSGTEPTTPRASGMRERSQGSGPLTLAFPSSIIDTRGGGPALAFSLAEKFSFPDAAPSRGSLVAGRGSWTRLVRHAPQGADPGLSPVCCLKCTSVLQGTWPS